MNRSARLKATLNTPGRANPLISGIQFVNQTNVIPEPGGTQGASLDVTSGRTATSGQKDVVAGSWYSAKKDHLALDASTQMDSKADAMEAMYSRGDGEDAIFNLKTFEEVQNDRKAKSGV